MALRRDFKCMPFLLLLVCLTDQPKQKALMAIWWLLIVLAILLILIFIICCYRWKKQGQYTFLTDKANKHGSDIPLTPQANGV